MRRLLTLALLFALLVSAAPAFAQYEELPINKIPPANTSNSQYIGPSTTSGIEITTSGELKQGAGNGHTDAFVFIPAIHACKGDTTNLTPTRVAASDWALTRIATAGGEVINISCSLNSWLSRVGGTKGVKITQVRIHHRITVVAAAATWGKIATVGFANATANDVGPDRATTPSLPTAVQSTPYLTSVSIASANQGFFPANANQSLDLEYAVELGMPSGRYDLYGLTVVFTRLDH